MDFESMPLAMKQQCHQWLCEQLENMSADDPRRYLLATARTRLFFELHPEQQYWRETQPGVTPAMLWPLPAIDLRLLGL